MIKLVLIKNKFSGFEFKPDDTVVIIDIYRASSTIVTALANGATQIIPCVEIEQVLNLKNKNSEFMGAGERNGEKISEFEFDNSPVSFNNPIVKNKVIALTTTNCTKAIEIAQISNNIIISCFLNISATIDNIENRSNEISRLVLLCAGNRHKESEEDNIFAAELILRLIDRLNLIIDESSEEIIKKRKNIDDLESFLTKTEHSRRLIDFGKRNDIDFSLKFDKFGCVPYYANGSIKIK